MNLFKKHKKIFSLGLILTIAVLVLTPLPFGLSDAHAVVGSLIGSLLGDIDSVLKNIFTWLGALVMTVSALLLGMAGLLLNSVTQFTIVDMNDNLSSLMTDGGGIYVAWTTFRDLANMFFIFIILYIAIGTILGLNGGSTKKLLVHVIIIALLLNFSLFFTKVIIDASNILTLGFHDAIITNNATDGLSGAFMQPLGLGKLYDVVGAQELLLAQEGYLGMIFLGLFGIILFCTTAFVFLMASLMLIMRYVILVFLMVVSPLAFLAMALPSGGRSKKWWDALISQALFAPVFMALLWTALILLQAFIKDIPQVTFSELIAKVISGEAPKEEMALLMNFAMIIGTVIFALVVSRQISESGAGSITQFGQKTAVNFSGSIARTALRPARFLHEKATQTRFFQGGGVGKVPTVLGGRLTQGIGKLASKAAQSSMESTLGSLVRTKIGTKSTYDAHQEDVRLRSNVDSIKDIITTKKAIAKLEKRGVPKDDKDLVKAKEELKIKESRLKDSIYTPELAETEKKQKDLERQLELLTEALKANTESKGPEIKPSSATPPGTPPSTPTT